ncbi:MAG: lipoprotein-releasing ABC transporter permease subunit [Pseudomonadales bacterium]|nr:lipoprotein-releasing ABC transporter permease subunit [Pseudomonadales bacterium]MCP5357393.1 lipoprotein-releasing ABC transporter permease subunit [Pseudomonadales bacterium]
MFKPVSLFIGLRYTRTRKKSQIISFVSVVSTLGITVGVLALIVVLSVINGSTSVMREETLKSVPHASIQGDEGLNDWPALREALVGRPGILGAAPYVAGEAWLRFDGGGEFVQLRGVAPALEHEVLQVESPGFDALLEKLGQEENGIILGLSLANRLGVYLGDEVTLMSLNSLVNRHLDEVMRFQVIGAADFGFYGNGNTVMVALGAAQHLFGNSTEAQALRLRVDDVFNAGTIASAALDTVPAQQRSQNLSSSSWSETQSSLFDALRLEKTLTGFMLLMIVVIGAVNIVSTLVMVVADKSADIAILRTMGASRGTIMSVFVTQGTAVGILGTLFGAVLGVLVSLNLTGILRGIENLLNTAFSPGDVYMISYLRAELRGEDVLLICLSALGISFLATLYPAYRATRIQPAEVLRYE